MLDNFIQGNGNVQVTSLPNGTGPSPPPPLNFVIKGNSATQNAITSVAGVTASTATSTNLSKGQNIIFNNMIQHQSQLVMQQPPSPLSTSMHQRGKFTLLMKYFACDFHYSCFG